jgi:serine/threonine protein kinase
MEAAPQAPGPLAWLQHAKRELGDPFDLLGDVLDGQFRVESFVGDGELSVVYKGHHLGVEAPVAIKCLNLPETLHPALARPLVQGFKRASRVQYRLARGNLHIAQAIASGSTLAPRTGVSIPYLVREWFDGEPLASELARRRLESREGRSLDETLALLEPAFDAVSYAHAQGEVHLALNPTNLFLAHATTAGAAPTLKVLDFGMAGTMGALGSGTSPASPQSPPGLRLMLPAYAAPEQLERTVGRLGPWTDVYALALILLEVLSDRIVMSTSETGALVERALDERRRPTPQSHGLKLPPYVDRALARAVARAPEARQRNAAELWREVSRPASVISLPWAAPQPPRPSPSILPLRVVPESGEPKGLEESENVNGAAPARATAAPAIAADPQRGSEPPTELEPETEVFRPAVLARKDHPHANDLSPKTPPVANWDRVRTDARALVVTSLHLLRPHASNIRALVLKGLPFCAAIGRRLVSTRRRKLIFLSMAVGLLSGALSWRHWSAGVPSNASVARAPTDSSRAPPPMPVPTKELELAAADLGPKTPFDRDLALRALDRKWRDVAKCRRGKAWGKESTTITFAEDGKLAEVVVGPLFQGTPTGQCITNVLSTVRVQRFDEGPASLDYRVYVAPR